MLTLSSLYGYESGADGDISVWLAGHGTINNRTPAIYYAHAAKCPHGPSGEIHSTCGGKWRGTMDTLF